MPSNEPRLGVGTVQFGMDYGITNTVGRVPESEVTHILATAAENGIRIIDTASLYGMSEAVLGRTLPRDIPWRVVSKTEKFRDQTNAAARLAETLQHSLELLRLDSLYGLLVHDAGDLLGSRGTEIWDALKRAKSQGLVSKIGASIYTADEAIQLMDRYELDLIQVPYNAVDRRLVKAGILQRLAASGVEVHARSAFLQGLLLSAPEEIDSRFGPLKGAIEGLSARFRSLGLSGLEGALAAVLERPEIHCAIVGVTSHADLKAILAALQKASQYAGKLAIDQWTVDDETILNPAEWPRLKGAR